MDPILLIGFLFFWFFPSALIGHTAMSRGRSPMFWLAASLVVSPVAGLVALLISGKSRECEPTNTPSGLRQKQQNTSIYKRPFVENGSTA